MCVRIRHGRLIECWILDSFPLGLTRFFFGRGTFRPKPDTSFHLLRELHHKKHRPRFNKQRFHCIARTYSLYIRYHTVHVTCCKQHSRHRESHTNFQSHFWVCNIDEPRGEVRWSATVPLDITTERSVGRDGDSSRSLQEHFGFDCSWLLSSYGAIHGADTRQNISGLAPA
jgi:hypothetical protein